MRSVAEAQVAVATVAFRRHTTKDKGGDPKQVAEAGGLPESVY